MIILNFKSYRESAGEKGLALVRICQKISQETGLRIIPCVQTADLGFISRQVEIPIWAQHFDLKETKKNTGWVTAHSLVQAGASGVLLNHSEHPLESSRLAEFVQTARDSKLETLIFASDLEEAGEFDKFRPDYLFLETPRLIAKEAMVHFDQEKEKIRKFAQSVYSFPLVGAGISKAEDVRESLALGVKGVGLSSAFVLAEEPEKVLRDLATGFK